MQSVIFSLGSGSEEIGFPRAAAAETAQVSAAQQSQWLIGTHWDKKIALNLNLVLWHFYFSHKSKPQSPSSLGTLKEASCLDRKYGTGRTVVESQVRKNGRCLARAVGTRGPSPGVFLTLSCNLKSRINKRTIPRIYSSNGCTASAKLESGRLSPVMLVLKVGRVVGR